MSNEHTKPEAFDPANDSNGGAEAIFEAEAEACAQQDAGETADAISPLLNQIAQLQSQVQEERERALRAIADLENFRKRLVRDKEEIRRKATADVIEDLLPALDNFQIGLQHAQKAQTGADVAKGFEFIVSQVNQILTGHGLAMLSPAVGDAFDHHVHEAVGHEPSDTTPDHHVLRLMRTGYSLNDRLLRPASVVVSSGAAQDGTGNGKDGAATGGGQAQT